MNLRHFSFLPLIFVAYAGTTRAAEPDYFVIKSVTIRQISAPDPEQKVQDYDQGLPGPIVFPSSLPQPAPVTLPGSTTLPAPSGSGGILSNVDIVGVGKEIWSIVDANQPVLNADINHYSALPANMTPDQLEHWSDPKKSEFQMVYTNMLGMDVVKFNYMITFQYGGEVNNAGKYIANASVIPSHVDVDWGYKLDAQVQNFPPTNIGSNKNPVALIQMALKWIVSSEFGKEQEGVSYSLDGNGRIIRN